MSVIGAVVMPHSPALLPASSKGQDHKLKDTIQACKDAAAQVAEWEPDLLVFLTPHASPLTDTFFVAPGKTAEGDLSAFDAPKISHKVTYDEDFREAILKSAGSFGLRVSTDCPDCDALDYGTLIPLTFLRKAGVKCPIVRFGLSSCDCFIHFDLGSCIAQTAAAMNRKVAIIASCDLSHALTEESPAPYAPEAKEFDEMIIKTLTNGNIPSLLTIEPEVEKKVAACGLGAVQAVAGALSEVPVVTPKFLSYEAPFGVGYAVVTFTVEKITEDEYEAACFEANLSWEDD